MKTRRILITVLAAAVVLTLFATGLTWAAGALLTPSSPEAAVGTGFSYQGYLTEGGNPADGTYDVKFDLYDDEVAVMTPLETVLVEDVDVDQGLFTVLLDFGTGAFDGEERWLEIGVRPGGESGAFTSLAGRQPINPTPYALYAVAAGSVAWTNVTDQPDLRPGFYQGALDTGGWVGEHTSITIGSDGLPIISYNDSSNYDLKTAHCNDTACTTTSINTLDSTGNVGRFMTSRLPTVVMCPAPAPALTLWTAQGMSVNTRPSPSGVTACPSSAITILPMRTSKQPTVMTSTAPLPALILWIVQEL